MFTRTVTSASPSCTPLWMTPSPGSCPVRDGTPPRMCGPSSSAWSASSMSPTLSGEACEADLMTGHYYYWHTSVYLMFTGKLSLDHISFCPFAALPMWTPVWCTEDSRRVKARTKNTKTSSGKQKTEPLKNVHFPISILCTFQETSDRFPCWGSEGPSGRPSHNGGVSHFIL